MKDMFSKILLPVLKIRDYLRLPAAAKAEFHNDRLGLPAEDPGIERAIEEGIGWLGRAQDNSLSRDGGVAHHFNLISGWGTSYPETTGYIVPTMLAYAESRGDDGALCRARRMLDWLVSIQLPNGGFQGGLIDSKPLVPVSFNTGQVLLGLVSGVRVFGEKYREAMCCAADFLVETQDPDGCWRKNPSPFAMPGEKAYDTHSAWGLLEAARMEGNRGYADSAIANVQWALRLQQENAWFDKCCLSDPSQPLTHTLGYVLRGIIEAYRHTKSPDLLKACTRTGDGLMGALREDGFLSGRLNSDWQGTVPWACLTGSVQIACCWFLLYQFTGDVRYREAARIANRYVRRTVKINGVPETRGAVKGSFPIYGGYGTYQYLNHACKFFVESNMFEEALQIHEGKTTGGVLDSFDNVKE